MSINIKELLELAKEIVKYAKDKTYKNHKDYAAIIELNYFISVHQQNIETIESKKILEKIQSGYYDDIHKIKVVKEQKYKLADDNMQYSFF